MAVYTIELGNLLKSGFDIDLNDYPIYKEEMREELNKGIIEHFYYREIGQETPQQFKFYLNRKMREIMPYYNQLLKSQEIEFNPLFNIDITETFQQEGETTSNSNQNVKNTTKNGGNVISVESETPQDRISNEQIKNNEYASRTNNVLDETNSTNENVGTSSNNQNDKQNYTKRTEGSSAGFPFSTAIKKWREIMINVFPMIYNELEICFMGVY